MFSAVLRDVTSLKKALSVISDLVDVGTFVVNETGLHMQSMDGSHVCLIYLRVPRGAFEVFELESPMVFGVKMSSLVGIFSCSSAGKDVRLDVSDDEAKISFETSSFTLRLIEAESEQMEIPDYEKTLDFTIPSTKFRDGIKDLSLFGDVVVITAKDGIVSFGSSGDIGRGEIKMAETREMNFVGEFALRYLSTFSKAFGVSPEVRLASAHEFPLEISYTMPENGTFSFHLAPKITEDAEM
jgi:proliferating cell nuclear antigen